MRKPLFLAALAAFLAWGAPSLTPAGAAWAQEATTEEPAPAEEAAAEQPAEEAPAAVAEMVQGAEDAPVTVIEYGSFTCPHCASWHEESYPQLKADYIDTGRVRFIFREVYFDRPGLWASMIARCGGEMRFFGIHDMIYEQQAEWIGDQQPATIADNLRRLGISAGLDQAQLDACLTDEAQAEALYAWFEANAEADGIDSTPTFLINGEKHSNMPWGEMQALIDAELAEAQE